MRVLLTGADGFVGPWVQREFAGAGHQVVVANGPSAATGPLDVSNGEQVSALVRELKPEAIVNLAGQSSVAASHAKPAATFAANTLGVVNVLAAVREHCPNARVLLIGSGEVYGSIASGTRATEELPLKPTSPYASSKAAAEVAGLQFVRSYGLDVVFARPFNHLGRGQAASFVVPSFARQLQAIRRREEAARILVGNLEPIRDFSHVADIARGYRLLLEKGVRGEAYNLCSGVAVSVRAVLDLLIQLAGVAVTVEVDPQRFRPSDAPCIVGDAQKLEALGWRREFSLEDVLREVLSDGAPSASTR